MELIVLVIFKQHNTYQIINLFLNLSGNNYRYRNLSLGYHSWPEGLDQLSLNELFKLKIKVPRSTIALFWQRLRTSSKPWCRLMGIDSCRISLLISPSKATPRVPHEASFLYNNKVLDHKWTTWNRTKKKFVICMKFHSNLF